MTNTSNPSPRLLPDLYYLPQLEQAATTMARWSRPQAVTAMPAEVIAHSLFLDLRGLALLIPGEQRPFRLDGSSMPAPGRKPSLLLRACAGARGKPSVFDPFLGFGVDALQLLQAGCSVTGIERNPLVYLLVRDFAARLALPLRSSCGDGAEALRQGDTHYDVVYLDPMFPQRNKTALPGRPMQLLRALACETPDEPASPLDVGELIEAASECARQRVVLKRRAKDPVVAKPQFQLKGQKVRFDVYV